MKLGKDFRAQITLYNIASFLHHNTILITMRKLLIITGFIFFVGCSTSTTGEITDNNEQDYSGQVDSRQDNLAMIFDAVEVDGKYTSRDSVAAFLCKFDKLPTNYIGKNQGKKIYEEKTGNSFSKWNFNPWTTIGYMIGGDVFENNEGLLPSGSYHEADVDYSGANRGTKRLIYQGNCTIYYTADHYESFKQILFD